MPPAKKTLKSAEEPLPAASEPEPAPESPVVEVQVPKAPRVRSFLCPIPVHGVNKFSNGIHGDVTLDYDKGLLRVTAKDKDKYRGVALVPMAMCVIVMDE